MSKKTTKTVKTNTKSTVFVRLSLEEADAILRHLERPDPDLPRAQIALVLRDQLLKAVQETAAGPTR